MNKGILDAALLNEISVLKKTLFDLDLELFSTNFKSDSSGWMKATRVKIPKRIVDDSKFKLIIKTNDNKYEIMEKRVVPFENYYTYDLANSDIIEPSRILDLKYKKYSIIVLTENVTLKYSYEYIIPDIKYVSVVNFEEDFINQEDENFIGTLTND